MRKYTVYVAIFVAALALRIHFNFNTTHVNAYQSCDAAEYLRNAVALDRVIKEIPLHIKEILPCLEGRALETTEIRKWLSPLSDLYISGPVFPAYLLACFKLTGSVVARDNWMVLLAVQSILSALTCLFITLSAELSFNRKTGIAAGIMACLYPAFIVNSGRLYTETFAAFLFSSLLFLTLRGCSKLKHATTADLTSGLLAACLQLTRSIMAALTLALLPIIWLNRKSGGPAKGIAAFVIGLACVLGPWLVFSKLAFGQSSPIVDRVSHYNFFMGNNVASQGWLSYPYPDGSGIEKKSMPRLFLDAFKPHPGQWLNLLLDKPLRLLKFPWNDFRTPIGIFTAPQQVAYHQIILFLALLGIALGALNAGARAPAPKELYGRLFLLGAFLFQLVYLAFITVPRYNLTIMPVLVVFAAHGLWFILDSIREKRTRLAAILLMVSAASLFFATKLDLVALFNQVVFHTNAYSSLLFSLALRTFLLLAVLSSVVMTIRPASGMRKVSYIASALIFAAILPLMVLPARANGRWYEWQCDLNKQGESLSTNIKLDAKLKEKLRAHEAFLLIDAGGQRSLTEGTSVEVNGCQLDAPVVPCLSLVQDLGDFKYEGAHRAYIECEYIFDCLTYEMGLSNCDLRQWFLMPLPNQVLANIDAANDLQVSIRKSASTPSHFFGTYATAHQMMPSLSICSWEKAFYGVEDDTGLTDNRLDEPDAPNMISEHGSALRALSGEDAVDLSKNAGLQTGNYLVRLLVLPDSNDKDQSMAFKCLQERDLNLAHNTSLVDLPSYDKDDTWVIRISGQSKELTGSAEQTGPSLTALVRSGDGHVYIPPWLPRYIQSDQRVFDYSFPLSPASLKGGVTSLELRKNETSPFFASVVNPPSKSRGSANWHDFKVRIYRVSGNPIRGSYRVQ